MGFLESFRGKRSPLEVARLEELKTTGFCLAVDCPGILYGHLQTMAEGYAYFPPWLSLNLLFEFLIQPIQPRRATSLPGFKVERRVGDEIIDTVEVLFLLEQDRSNQVEVSLVGYVDMATAELSYAPVKNRGELVHQLRLRGLSARLKREKPDPAWILSAATGPGRASVGIFLGYETSELAKTYQREGLAHNNPLVLAGFSGVLPTSFGEFRRQLGEFQWVMSHFLDGLYIVTGRRPPNVLIYLDK